VGEEEAHPLQPPLPPRSIPPNFIWQRLLSDAWAIVCGVLVLLGAIFTMLGVVLTLGIITAFVGIPFVFTGLPLLLSGCVGIYLRYEQTKKLVNVIQYGQAVQGRITTVEQDFSVQINQRYPWVIQYTFTVLGQAWQGKVKTLRQPDAQTQKGAEVYILYLSNDPTQNSLYPHP
jgi:hypothetical protein